MPTITEVSAATKEEAEERKQNFLIDDPEPVVVIIENKDGTFTVRATYP
jgi:hypothetical protein